MNDTNLQVDSDFTYEQFGPEAGGESLPVVLPSGTIFVSAVNGLAGNVTFSGGSTGLTFTPAGAVVSLGGTLAVANGGTGAGTAAAARTNLGLVKMNSAAVAPAVTDDAAAGYSVNSLWTDTVLDDAYICVDSTNGAAVWKKITP